MQEVDILVLGAGWTATFLVPELQSASLSYALTTTTGRDNTIKFKFDPTNPDQKHAFSLLPAARYVLITFPVPTQAAATLLLDSYIATHPADNTRYLVLGSTGIWSRPEKQDAPWMTRHSKYDADDARVKTEETYLSRGAAVLNLSGLWDGVVRDARHWIPRVAKTKDAVRAKTSIHLIHGVDVARAIVAVVKAWEADRGKDEGRRCRGQRWMLTDGFVYDWWSLMAGWADVEGGPTEQATWVYELMVETGVRALPRSMEALGRCYDTREFWDTFGVVPLKARIP